MPIPMDAVCHEAISPQSAPMHHKGWPIKHHQLSPNQVLSIEFSTTCGEEHPPLYCCHAIIISYPHIRGANAPFLMENELIKLVLVCLDE